MRSRPRLRSRIIYWIMLPVLGMGGLIALVLIEVTLPPLVGLITTRVDANLRLASRLGIDTCEDSFNYLLELRL